MTGVGGATAGEAKPPRPAEHSALGTGSPAAADGPGDDRDLRAGAAGRPRWRRVAGGLLALALLFAGAVYLYQRRDVLLQHLELRPAVLPLVVLFETVLLVTRGLLTREVARPFGVRLRVVEAVNLSSWSTLANYLAPLVGGTGVRAVYLKRQHRLPFSHFLSLQMATYTLHFAITSALGLAALAVLGLPGGAVARLLAVAFAGVGASCLLVLAAAPRLAVPLRWLPGRLARRLAPVLDGVVRLRGMRKGRLVALLLAILLASAASIHSAFALVGVPLAPWSALLVATVAAFSVVLSITPAAFGITESIIVFAAGLVAVAPAVALTAAGIKRLVAVAVVTAGAGLAGLGRRG
ncbi:MAG TPA: lysylphosphatidylglycerol synthase domain-containing protein [Thermoanaerobaculia bacterium]|nr:lysylphosphatidylglycerol synthase domain-containing protein [Thermoanaerobaculia bacterium]